MNERRNKRTNECTEGRKDRRTKGRADGRTNERTNTYDSQFARSGVQVEAEVAISEVGNGRKCTLITHYRTSLISHYTRSNFSVPLFYRPISKLKVYSNPQAFSAFLAITLGNGLVYSLCPKCITLANVTFIKNYTILPLTQFWRYVLVLKNTTTVFDCDKQ